MGENVCPVCGYDGLDEPPFNERGAGSYDICPCCGFQFGLDDFPYEDRERLIAEWRERWVAGGCRWKYATGCRRPPRAGTRRRSWHAPGA